MTISSLSMSAAVVLAAVVLALVTATEPAGAAFPGKNGKLAFDQVIKGAGS